MQSGILDTTGRLAAFTGVVFFACVMAAPDPHRRVENPSAEQLKQFYLDTHQSFRTSLLLVGLAYAFFLVFVAALRTRLSRAEGGSATLSNLVLGAGVLVAGFYVLGTALRVVPAFGLVTEKTDATEARIWGLFADASFNTLVEASTVWRGVMLGAIGLIVVRYGGLPRWLGWTAAVVASGALTAPVLDWLETPAHAAGSVVGMGSHIAFYFWILAASVVMVGLAGREHNTSEGGPLMNETTRVRRAGAVTTLLTVAALALAPSALAGYQDLRSPDTRDRAEAVQPWFDLRSPDTRDAASRPNRLVEPKQQPTAVSVGKDGFDWSDAGIGAAATVGATLLLLGGVSLTGTRRRRTVIAH